LSYEYAPVYMLQWLDDDPTYSLIEAVMKTGSSPIHQVMLTEKKSGRRVFYTDSEPKAKLLAASGKPVRVTPIQYKVSENLGEHPTHTVMLKDEAERQIEWRFIQASDPSERGKGLSAAAPPLEFLYRNLGTAAGEGTAIQIGQKVSQAKPWPEISAPPYFSA